MRYVSELVISIFSEPNLAFHKALFLSPKNNVEGALAVLNAANCDVWIKPREQCLPKVIDDVLVQKHITILDLPSADELLDAHSIPPFPFYTKQYKCTIKKIYTYIFLER